MFVQSIPMWLHFLFGGGEGGFLGAGSFKGET